MAVTRVLTAKFQRMDKPKKTVPSEKEKPFKEINLHVNEFGQIIRDVALEDIKQFLDENVPDKKLDDMDDKPIA